MTLLQPTSAISYWYAFDFASGSGSESSSTTDLRAGRDENGPPNQAVTVLEFDVSAIDLTSMTSVKIVLNYVAPWHNDRKFQVSSALDTVAATTYSAVRTAANAASVKVDKDFTGTATGSAIEVDLSTMVGAADASTLLIYIVDSPNPGASGNPASMGLRFSSPELDYTAPSAAPAREFLG